MANVINEKYHKPMFCHMISNSFIRKLNFHQAFCGFVWRFIESVQIKIQAPNVRKCDKVASPRCCVWGRECSWAKSLAGHLSGSIYTDVTQCHKLLSAISKMGPFLILNEWFYDCPLSFKKYKSKLLRNFFLNLDPWSLNPKFWICKLIQVRE